MRGTTLRSFCLPLVVCFVATSLHAAGPKKTDTEWLATPAEAARIARVENNLAPVILKGEAPIRLSLQQWMHLSKIPGLSVAVFENYELVWAKSYGVKESGKPDPVRLDTLFQAASISKPVTALAVLHYVEAGKFSLDENINGKLLSWQVPENQFTKDQKVTLRQLLSHSAGTTVHGFPGYAVNEPIPALVQILNGEQPANTDAVRVDMVPGTKFRYSGGGTTIVQLLLMDQIKKPFPQIMDETVIRPLALLRSSYEQPLPPPRAALAASGHRADGKMIEGRWHIYPEIAAAGLWTTPSDLARVAIEVAKSKSGKSNKILSQAMTRQMLTVQAEPLGLGWFLNPKSDEFGHTGGNEGFQSYLVAFADSGNGVAIMANSDNGFMVLDRLAQAVAKEYGWTAFRSQPEPVFIKLAQIWQLKGADAALAQYHALRGEEPADQAKPGDLNSFGYVLLRAEKIPEAIKVFNANVALYPKDANAYDSLAEAYMKAGKNDLAIANYRRSLALNSKNNNAVKMLKKLGVEWVPEDRTEK